MTTNPKGFQGILAWQKSFALAKAVYKSFSLCKDYSFRDQIQRASVSIMNNIAEGSAQKSDKSFYNYSRIAKGSCAEVESMLLLARELDYIDTTTSMELMKLTDETSRILNGLMKKLKAESS